MTSPLPLIPTPRHVRMGEGSFRHPDPLEALTCEIDTALAAEEYALSVSESAAYLRAGSEDGLARGRATWEQVVRLSALDHAGHEGTTDPDGAAPRVRVPTLEIHDAPAFAWRGLMLDPCRHFLPLDELYRMVDVLALYRFSVLHLHLNDDQGWRIEIEGYPRLTEVGAWREATVVGHPSARPDEDTYRSERHGGFYTQAELRELVAYAKGRGITIVPEIDLPGHMQAAVAAYPELGNRPEAPVGVRTTWGISEDVLGVSDEAFAFVRAVLTQVCGIFDAPFVHIGGDEVPRVQWRESAAARAAADAWGLASVDDIQGEFTRVAHDVLAAHGRAGVGWDEVLDAPLPADTVVMNWRGADGAARALERGHRTVISTSSVLYLDFPQSSEGEPLAAAWGGPTTLETVAGAPLLPPHLSAEERALVLGIQAQAWSEYIPTPEHLHYMLFPRLLAVAERAWNEDVPGTMEDFEQRVRAHEALLSDLGIGYRPR